MSPPPSSPHTADPGETAARSGSRPAWLRIPPGVDRTRLAWAVTGGVVGLVAAIVISWWTFRNEGDRITATTIGYKVVDDTSVRVSFDVSRPEGLPVTCTLRALDRHFTVVGSADVVVPVSAERVVHQNGTVRTASRAVTGVVQDCVRT